MKPKVYARKFLRISPDTPLYGSARIVSIGNRRVSTGIAIVRILNISSGGLRFVSKLSMPVDHTVILQLNLRLDKTAYCIQGYIVYLNSNPLLFLKRHLQLHKAKNQPLLIYNFSIFYFMFIAVKFRHY